MNCNSANGACATLLDSSSLVQKHGSAARISNRYHFQHGPIDIIATFEGSAAAVASALALAWNRFLSVLPELVAELPELRKAINRESMPLCNGAIARQMILASSPFYEQFEQFITPMAAVAGCVADELLEAVLACGLQKIIVNNGGDISLASQPGETITVQILAPHGTIQLNNDDRRAVQRFGIATSGWSGRSFSLGIADAVTVVARTAGQADAAATMIANAVGGLLEHPNIKRAAANSIKDDSDLGSTLVTTHVGKLEPELIQQELARGAQFARSCLNNGKIIAATIYLQGESVIVENYDRNSKSIHAN